jgi:hypothetical protein
MSYPCLSFVLHLNLHTGLTPSYAPVRLRAESVRSPNRDRDLESPQVRNRSKFVLEDLYIRPIKPSTNWEDRGNNQCSPLCRRLKNGHPQ